MTPEREQQILQEARDRLKRSMEEDSENRRLALEDLEFIGVEGAQWPSAIRSERETDGRPCITTNKMPTFIDQVVGDQRQNRPSIKVIPVDDKSDPYMAQILGGWVKHVQQVSRSDVAIDHAFEHAVSCAYGAIRVVTEYSDDDSFEQDVYIRKIDNALAVYWGRHTEYDCSDAMYCFVITDMDRDEYKEKYKIDPMPFNEADSQYVSGWCTDKTVRLAEYFVKEASEKTIYLLNNGRTVDTLDEFDKENIAKQRKTLGYTIKWYLLSGNKVLQDLTWVGKKYIPIIPVWGKEINVGGKRIIRGLIRNAKDSQRMYNYFSSCNTELVALAPKTPYMVTPKQIEGHTNQWNEAHKKNFAYLLTNPDPKAPGWPKREAPPQASSAMIEAIRMSDQEIRDTMGLQQASMGMKSNERSGAAIRERKREGDIGTFAFIDNLARSIEHLGRVLIDVAPGVLDTERIIRLGLENGLHKFEAINVQTADGEILHDITIGKYDVTVTVGPSFTTQRTEARQSMGEFIQYYPQAAPLIGDLYAKSMDWPGAEEMADRLSYLLPPEIKAAKEKEAAQNSGQEPPLPPQPDMANQPPPDPLMILKIKEAELDLKLKDLEVQQEEVKLEGLKLDNQIKEVTGKDQIKSMIEEIIQEETQGEQEPTIPGRAMGGDVTAGQPYRVGEAGPEVFIPKNDGTIIPHNGGLRPDGTPKGMGWLGVLKRPDGKVSTELSVGVNMGGVERLIPVLVPTLSPEEVQTVISTPEGQRFPNSIIQKAVDHAHYQIKAGRSPFKDE